jgi:hypothetical protein
VASRIPHIVREDSPRPHRPGGPQIAPAVAIDRLGKSEDFERADAIGTFWGHPGTRTFGELLIDLEEDPAMRAVLVRMLREATANIDRHSSL